MELANPAGLSSVQLTPFRLWLAWDEQECFLDHHDFPWFKEATVSQVFHVEVLSADHL